MYDEEKVTYFGLTDARNKRVRFGIKAKDRARHVYTIGKTGMGKSTLLENLAVQDIQNGEGLAFIDPHGKSADLLLEYIPEHRKKDVVYFAPFDLDYPIAFNALEDVDVTKRYLVANGLMSAFKTIWVDAFSARMEYILNNIMLALLEYPSSTLMSVNRMLTDKDFRNAVVANVTDPTVKAFWVDEYAKYTEKFAAEAAPAIQNKVGQFVGNPLVRNIIGQPVSGFDIRDIMDNKKILIVNLSKGRVGEANANLLGAMLITKIYLAAMSRADLKEEELKNTPQFYLYVDEFQNFANETFADILSEARKYKLSLTIAHQYVEQMTEDVRAAVFGNVGTMITFRVGAYDAAVFEKEYSPEFTAEDMVNLQQYQMYLKLMIDGVTSRPFSAIGMPPIARPEISYVEEIINLSRSQFANPREKVEEDIRDWHMQKIGAKEVVKKTSEKSSASERSSSDRPSSSRSSERSSSSDRSSERASGRSLERSTERSRDRSSEKINEGRAERAPRQEPRGRDIERDRTVMSRRDEAAIRARDEDRPVIARRSVEKPVDHSIDKSAELAVEKMFESPAVTMATDTVVAPAVTPVAPKPSHVSLNTLSHGNENKVKNQQKDIKPENVAALREALLSVMGDSEIKVETKEIKESVDANKVMENKDNLTSNEVKYDAGELKNKQEEDKASHAGALTPDDLKRILDINQ